MAKVGAILFDEFHERGAEGDLGLSLALDVQQHTNPELRSAFLHLPATTQGVCSACCEGIASQCCCRPWCPAGRACAGTWASSIATEPATVQHPSLAKGSRPLVGGACQLLSEAAVI